MSEQVSYEKRPFIVRQPRLKLWHMAIIGFLIALAINLTISSVSVVSQYIVTAVLSLSIIGLLYIVQNRGIDQRTATEFQSLVFSAAMRVNSLLTLILYKDGSVFYLDPRYVSDFSQGSPYHNLDQFLTTMGVENADKVHIYDSIRDLEKAEFEYVYKAGRKSAPMRIAVYPLLRPEGFVALNVTGK